MATYSKLALSGGTANGRGILVASNTIATPTMIHTTGASGFEEIWIYAVNTSASSVKLTLLWGGTTDPNDTIEFTVPAENGLYLVAPGLILQGSSLSVRAFAATASVVALHGYVNRVV